MQRTMKLFMWGYQAHFRLDLESLATSVVQRVTPELQPKALLIGLRRPGEQDDNAVCVEPQSEAWPVQLFAELPRQVDALIRTEALRDLVLDSARAQRDKPEVLRQNAVHRAVAAAMAGYDDRHDTVSFCGRAAAVEKFHVVPILQVPRSRLSAYPVLDVPHGDGRLQAPTSLLHAIFDVVLEEAYEELVHPEPGRFHTRMTRNADELRREAARRFMKGIGLAIGDRYWYGDLFDRLDLISSLRTDEGDEKGQLVLASADHPALHYSLRVAEPVPLREHRWARRMLRMAGDGLCLLADCRQINGLGRLIDVHEAGTEDAFVVHFMGRSTWELRCGDRVHLRTRFGLPGLQEPTLERGRFCSNFQRQFKRATELSAARLWELFSAVRSDSLGGLLVVTEDAAEEANRLRGQATSVEPTVLSADVMRRAAALGGAVLLDPQLRCHAVGVTLDGAATEECSPALDAQVNAAMRYQAAAKGATLVIAVGENQRVMIRPLLRPRIRRAELSRAIVALESAPPDGYTAPQRWLDAHRFYLNDEQCERVNDALDRLEGLRRREGDTVVLTRRFFSSPELDDSYFL